MQQQVRQALASFRCQQHLLVTSHLLLLLMLMVTALTLLPLLQLQAVGVEACRWQQLGPHSLLQLLLLKQQLLLRQHRQETLLL